MRWLYLAACVLLSALFGRKQTDPWTPERKRRAVRNAIREREQRGML